MHEPVLLKETIDGLNIQNGDIFVDATVGFAGHSSLVCERFGRKVKIIALDLDNNALDSARAKLSSCDAYFFNHNFRNIDKALEEMNIENVDKIMADLGVSSYELDTSGRGFSFQKDEPLLMTLKDKPNKEDITAEYILNNWEESTLADIIYGFGEERYARRIAKKIVEARVTGRIETTFQLVDIIKSAVPAVYTRGKTHFATRTFQALRIATNDELGSIEEFIKKAIDALSDKGRLAVISFHSLEDRIVKRMFKQYEKDGRVKILTKKPIVPTDEEISINKRSRSAKLRIIEKNDK